MCLPADPDGGWRQLVEDFSVNGYVVCEDHDLILRLPQCVTPLEIFVEVKAPSAAGNTDAERLIDASSVQAILRREETPRSNLEWDEYPEPLWDPLKSEVRQLVREYFEQADADSD
jgi:hypothetical protein